MMALNLMVIGGGYVGLSGAAMYAAKGHAVTVVDKNPTVVKEINAGRCPVFGLEDFLGFSLKPLTQNYMLRARGSIAEASMPKTVYPHAVFIAVPTESNGVVSNLLVLSVMHELVQLSDLLPQELVVVVESTIPPGTMDAILKMGHPNGWTIAHAPRRDWFETQRHRMDAITRPYGVAFEGGVYQQHHQSVANILGIVSPNLIRGHYRSVELVKPLENALYYLPIVYARQQAERFPDVDMNEVLRLVGTHYARPEYFINWGTGGYCIPISPRYLNDVEKHGIDLQTDDLGLKAIEIEGVHRAHVRLKIASNFKFRNVLLLGWSYKSGTQLTHGSESVPLARLLAGNGQQVRVIDPLFNSQTDPPLRGYPNVKWYDSQEGLEPDGIFLMNQHKLFSSLELIEDLVRGSRDKVVLDGTGQWEPYRHWLLAKKVHYRRMYSPKWAEPVDG